MTKLETMKNILRSGNYKEVRLISNSEYHFLNYSTKDAEGNYHSTQAGTQYSLSVSFIRGSLEIDSLKELISNIIDVVGRHTIICYKYEVSNVIRRLGTRYWSPTRDTGRDRLEITIYTTKDRNNDKKLTINTIQNWNVLKPEMIDAVKY